MKSHTLLFVAALLASSALPARADSLRCSGGFADVGDSRLSVLYKCGEPTLADSYCSPVYYRPAGRPGRPLPGRRRVDLRSRPGEPDGDRPIHVGKSAVDQLRAGASVERDRTRRSRSRRSASKRRQVREPERFSLAHRYRPKHRFGVAARGSTPRIDAFALVEPLASRAPCQARLRAHARREQFDGFIPVAVHPMLPSWRRDEACPRAEFRAIDRAAYDHGRIAAAQPAYSGGSRTP